MEHDSTEENLRTLGGWSQRYGRPLAPYTDKNSIFRHRSGAAALQEQLRGDGTTDLGPEDCHDCTDRMEKRSVLRRPTFETTNSLSVSDRVPSILEILSGGGRRVLETLWFESESQPGS